MAGPTLTKTVVDGLKPSDAAYFLWDGKLKGFGVKVLPSGRKVYVAQYRPRAQRASRRATLGAHGPLTVDSARKLAQETLGKVAAGENPAQLLRTDKEAPTLASAVPRYLTRLEGLRKPRTVAWVSGLFEGYILPRLGNRRMVDLTTGEVSRLHQQLRATPFQANRVLANLSAFCSWAEREGLRPSGTNPCRGVSRYREHKRERYLGAEELARLGAVLREAEKLGLAPSEKARKGYAEGGMDAPDRLPIDSDAVSVIWLLLFTGCRRSEILGLRWREVDLERGELRLGESKTGRSVRPLNSAASEILANRPRHATSAFVFPGLDPKKPRAEISRAWRRIRESAGLSEVRLHDLRHTYASIALNSGSSLPMIGGLLGHTQPSTTQRYAHLANDPLAQVSERAGSDMAAALKGTKTPVTPLRRRKRLA